MPAPEAGLRGAAVVAAAMLVVCASVASASEREDSASVEQHSGGIVVGPGPASGSRSPPSSSPSPAVASSRATTVAPRGGSAGIRIVPVAEPTIEEELLFDLVNIEREARGLPRLRWDGTLSRLARMHAADMKRTGRASHHSSRDGASFGQRLARTTFRVRAVAENLAYNATLTSAHRALMASPGHRRNILDPELTALGTAVLHDPRRRRIWVVEDFATPIAHVTDAEAADRLGRALSRSRRWQLPEDEGLSRQLDGLLEQMVATGRVQPVVPATEEAGWALSFTSLDPDAAPSSAVEKARRADGYAMAVTFRKTRRYPFGAYWGIVFLKGAY